MIPYRAEFKARGYSSVSLLVKGNFYRSFYEGLNGEVFGCERKDRENYDTSNIKDGIWDSVEQSRADKGVEGFKGDESTKFVNLKVSDRGFKDLDSS